MTLPFVAILNTDRDIERPIHYFGQTQEQVSRLANDYLNAKGKHGDSFSICEFVRVERSVIECDKPPAPMPEPEWRTHPFKTGKAPLRCDVCNATYGEHIKA